MKKILLFIITLLPLIVVSQQIRYEQLVPIQITRLSSDGHDSGKFARSDGTGGVVLEFVLLDTTDIVKTSWNAYIEALIGDVTGTSVDLTGIRDTLQLHSDSLGIAFDSISIHRGILNDLLVRKIDTLEIDIEKANWEIFISRIINELGLEPDLSNYVTRIELGDSISNLRSEIPLYLIELDSTGFSLDTTQIRNLKTYVNNNSTPGDNIYNSDGTLTGNRRLSLGTGNLVFGGATRDYFLLQHNNVPILGNFTPTWTGDHSYIAFYEDALIIDGYKESTDQWFTWDITLDGATQLGKGNFSTGKSNLFEMYTPDSNPNDYWFYLGGTVDDWATQKWLKLSGDSIWTNIGEFKINNKRVLVEGDITEEVDPIFTSWDKSYLDLTNLPNFQDSIILYTPEHNDLQGLQGGMMEEYYHLTENELIKLRDSVYTEILISDVIGLSDSISIYSDTLSAHNLRLLNLENFDIVEIADLQGIRDTLNLHSDSLVNYNLRLIEVEGLDTAGIYHWNRELLDNITSSDTVRWGDYSIWDKNYFDLTNLPNFQDSVATYQTDSQQLSIDSTNRVFTVSLENGGTIKFEDTNTTYDLSGYATRSELNDTADVVRSEIPNLLTELDSIGFSLDTTQVRSLNEFVVNKIPNYATPNLHEVSSIDSITSHELTVGGLRSDGDVYVGNETEKSDLTIRGNLFIKSVEVEQFEFPESPGLGLWYYDVEGADKSAVIAVRDYGGSNEQRPLIISAEEVSFLDELDSTRLIVSDNVGIGTSVPSEKLEVSGEVRHEPATWFENSATLGQLTDSISALTLTKIDSTGFSLDTTQIRGLLEFVLNNSSGSVSTGTGTEILNEKPQGVKDGSNKTFTLALTPSVNTIQLYLNGLRQSYIDDFTATGNTITFVYAPISTDKIIADYYVLDEDFIPMSETNLFGKNLSSDDIDTRLIYLSGTVYEGEVDVRGNENPTSTSAAARQTLYDNYVLVIYNEGFTP